MPEKFEVMTNADLVQTQRMFEQLHLTLKANPGKLLDEKYISAIWPILKINLQKIIFLAKDKKLSDEKNFLILLSYLKKLNNYFTKGLEDRKAKKIEFYLNALAPYIQCDQLTLSLTPGGRLNYQTTSDYSGVPTIFKTAHHEKPIKVLDNISNQKEIISVPTQSKKESDYANKKDWLVLAGVVFTSAITIGVMLAAYYIFVGKKEMNYFFSLFGKKAVTPEKHKPSTPSPGV